MPRRRPRPPLFKLGVLLVGAAVAVALADALGRLNLVERAVGGLVAQSGVRRIADALARSRWSMALLALGLGCLGMAALGTSRRSARRVRRAVRPTRRARRPRRSPARTSPRR